jgi:hypothetical protein
LIRSGDEILLHIPNVTTEAKVRVVASVVCGIEVVVEAARTGPEYDIAKKVIAEYADTLARLAKS